MLDFPPGSLPPQLRGIYQPTVMLTKDQLVVSATTAAALRAGAASKGGAEGAGGRRVAFGAMARRLPANLVLLNVNDLRESIPTLIEKLPMLADQLNQAHRAGPAAIGRAWSGFGVANRSGEIAHGRRGEPFAFPRFDGTGGR